MRAARPRPVTRYGSPVSDRRRLALVGNPTAGKGRALQYGTAAAALLRAAGHEVDDLTGESFDHSLERARAAVRGGADVLVVAGGDGMVHLGVNAVAGTSVPLAVLACGTGNDVATSLDLPVHDLPAAVRTVLEGIPRRIDAVRQTEPDDGGGDEAGHWYAGVLCGGFDAIVNERANGWRWPRGRLRYDLAIARELPVFRPLAYELVLDGERWQTEAMLVAVGNGPRYGGGMKIAPDATYDDGLLDVVVVGRMSVLGLARAFPKIYSGRHVHHPAVTVRRARSVRLSARGITAYADGERFGPLPLTLEAVPGAVTILVPPAVSRPADASAGAAADPRPGRRRVR
jgi:diacylglycerol kinase (ATP)